MTLVRRSQPRFKPVLLLPFSLGLLGCEDGYDEPTLHRPAPATVVVQAGEIAGREIRGCAFNGSDELGNSDGGTIVVWARASSDSGGTAVLSLPFDPSGDLDESDEMNSIAAQVPAGGSASLEEEHFFTQVSGITRGLFFAEDQRCTEWKTVEFAWTNVTGTDPLLVDWEIGFGLEIEESVEVGIDFRTYD